MGSCLINISKLLTKEYRTPDSEGCIYMPFRGYIVFGCVHATRNAISNSQNYDQ